MIKKGTVIANMKAANLVPQKLAPKHVNENYSNNSEKAQATPECIEKLFSKLDIKSSEIWETNIQAKLGKVFTDFHHVFALDDLEIGHMNMVKHVIRLVNQVPFHEIYRRIPLLQYKEVKNHLKEKLEIVEILKSQSSWTSVMVLVCKKDGAFRFCIDLHKLNVCTIKDTQTLPHIGESLDSLCGAVTFTSLDLKSGYWQVKLDKDNIPYTAFTVGPLWFYECL